MTYLFENSSDERAEQPFDQPQVSVLAPFTLNLPPVPFSNRDREEARDFPVVRAHSEEYTYAEERPHAELHAAVTERRRASDRRREARPTSDRRAFASEHMAPPLSGPYDPRPMAEAPYAAADPLPAPLDTRLPEIPEFEQLLPALPVQLKNRGAASIPTRSTRPSAVNSQFAQSMLAQAQAEVEVAAPAQAPMPDTILTTDPAPAPEPMSMPMPAAAQPLAPVAVHQPVAIQQEQLASVFTPAFYENDVAPIATATAPSAPAAEPTSDELLIWNRGVEMSDTAAPNYAAATHMDHDAFHAPVSPVVSTTPLVSNSASAKQPVSRKKMLVVAAAIPTVFGVGLAFIAERFMM